MSNALQTMGAERFLESRGLQDYARRIIEVTEARTVEDLKMLDKDMVEDVVHITQMKMISAKKFREAVEEVKELHSAVPQVQPPDAQAQPAAEYAQPPAQPAALYPLPPAQPAYAPPPAQPDQAIQAQPVQATPVQAQPVYAQGYMQPPYAQVGQASYTPPAYGQDARAQQKKQSDGLGMGAVLAGGAAALLGGMMLGEALEHNHHHHGHRHHRHRHRDIFDLEIDFGGHHHHHGRHHHRHHHHCW